MAPEFRSLGRFVCFRPAFLTQCSPATSQVLSREPLADPGLAVTRALSGGASRAGQGRATQSRATQSRAKEGRQSRRSRGFSCVIAALGWPYPNRPIGWQRSLFALNPKLATSCAGIATRARPRWRADLRAPPNFAYAHQCQQDPWTSSLFSGWRCTAAIPGGNCSWFNGWWLRRLRYTVNGVQCNLRGAVEWSHRSASSAPLSQIWSVPGLRPSGRLTG